MKIFCALCLVVPQKYGQDFVCREWKKIEEHWVRPGVVNFFVRRARYLYMKSLAGRMIIRWAVADRALIIFSPFLTSCIRYSNCLEWMTYFFVFTKLHRLFADLSFIRHVILLFLVTVCWPVKISLAGLIRLTVRICPCLGYTIPCSARRNKLEAYSQLLQKRAEWIERLPLKR